MQTKNKIVIMAVIATFFLIQMPVMAADFNITTTAHFDAGSKSDSLGNYEIETFTDNGNITANAFELGNKYGDKFTFADADALTWKWKETTTDDSPWNPAGGQNMDINLSADGVMWMETDKGSGARVFGGRTINETFTGEFDIRVNVKVLPTPDGGTYYRMILWVSGTDYVDFVFYAQPAVQDLVSNIYVGGVKTEHRFDDFNDDNISIRITRDGANVLKTWYDRAGGDSWTVLGTKSGFNAGNASISLYVISGAGVAEDLTVNWADFLINTGTFASGGYQTTGIWTSNTTVMPTLRQVSNTTINFSNANSSNFIDAIQWLDASTETVLAAYTIDITNGTEILIEESNLTVGSFADVNTNFKIRLFLDGNGSSTITINEIFGDFSISGAPTPPKITGITRITISIMPLLISLGLIIGFSTFIMAKKMNLITMAIYMIVATSTIIVVYQLISNVLMA